MDSSEYSAVTEYYKLQDTKAVIADCKTCSGGPTV